jgi:hypothetical protein
MFATVDAVTMWLSAISACVGATHVSYQRFIANRIAAGYRDNRVLPAMSGAHSFWGELRQGTEHDIFDSF